MTKVSYTANPAGVVDFHALAVVVAAVTMLADFFVSVNDAVGWPLGAAMTCFMMSSFAALPHKGFLRLDDVSRELTFLLLSQKEQITSLRNVILIIASIIKSSIQNYPHAGVR
ncbi:hypothetical protein KJ590_03215 [Patescibacteria group bacterium]|nr:hypothetical protein [Patescibacteria group bacterium]